MHYATVPRQNPVLSNCFIKKNIKSIAEVKSEQRKCLKAGGVGGVGVLPEEESERWNEVLLH